MPPIEEAELTPLLSPSISMEENVELCWLPSEEEVKDADVVEATREFFTGALLSKFYGASFIVLIPKIPGPKSFDKFRLISLCSVAYKMFSKILVARLNAILPRLVFPEQEAFIPGRSIFENISLTQEMVHGMNKKNLGGNVILKIDMAKVYDRENLSRLLRKQFEDGRIGKFYHPMGASMVSHLLYADDVLIFLNGEKRSLHRLGSILAVYERWSGQRISREKSSIFASISISCARRRSLVRLTGFAEGHFPMTYLGVPLVQGRLKACHLKQMLVKI
ncbi:hypothetical protein F2P56_012363 [Juglans regia]|uniref:Reverse transcriptase domain-containing protein n=2 Tax=Juglans regia TaxID=51240 RepID=A0A833XJU3_JUGRE|nr:uncharacterized protein LOC109020104 [Juglans regia]KAF5468188.1 hypothetical protein F2P56_012363 [Juglans regia]